MEHVNKHGHPPDVTVLLVTMVTNAVSVLTWIFSRESYESLKQRDDIVLYNC